MCVRQDAIVTHGKPLPQFSRARIYKLLRYPSVKDVRCLPRPLHLSLASPRVQYSLGPFMVELFGGSAFNGVPAGVSQRNDRLPGRYLPTPATLCELAFEKQALTPQAGLRHVKLATKVACPIAVGRSTWPHPLRTDTAFSQRLLSRR